MSIYTLESIMTLELEIFDAWWHPYITYQEIWNMTREHREHLQCKPEWEPIVRFCLMWTTTIAKPTVYDFLDFIGGRQTNMNSSLSEYTKLKLKSENEPENYEFIYDSRERNIEKAPHIKFSVKIERNDTINFGRSLIRAFRDTVPLDIHETPCKTFMRPYNLIWIKEVEEPYRLEIKKEN